MSTLNQSANSNQKMLLLKSGGKVTLKNGGGGSVGSSSQQLSGFCNKLEVRQVIEQARGFLSLVRG